MVLCVFGTVYRDGADLDEEARLSREMAEVASDMPGFISYKSYTSPDGEEIGIIRFRSRGALKGWRDHPAHRDAWDQAPLFYREFWVQNCETFDDYVWIDGVHHDRDQSERFRMTREEVVGARASAHEARTASQTSLKPPPHARTRGPGGRPAGPPSVSF